MYDLKNFNLSEMTTCGKALRDLSAKSSTMEEVASKVTRYFYEEFFDKESNGPALVLVRLFKTHPYGELSEELKDFADKVMKNRTLNAETKCLTLLASSGELPDWNLKERSSGHRTIPLVSEEVVTSIPMIANLILQLGLDISHVVKPDPAMILDIAKKKYNVFFVPSALGSSYIPSQENFVIPHKVKSVVGFGGVFPSGHLFAVILFSKILLAKETADLFKTLALNIKLSLLEFEDKVFSS